MNDLRQAVNEAVTYDEAAAFALISAASWRENPLGEFLGDGFRLAALHGREAVFREMDGETDTDEFSEADNFGLAFKEQIDFLEQKHVKPTRAWTDALRGDHDRAFVVAGATDTAMLEDFQNSLLKVKKEGLLFAEFQKDFDRIVRQYGWDHTGGREWRARTIFETNMRTSYMAGRLAQMRDPDVIRLRPWWQYRHGVTRKPKNPRPAHLAWDGLTLRHDNVTWKTIFAPNGFKCSCSVVTLSDRDLEKLGKAGGDETPVLLTEPHIDPVTGQMVEKVQHVDYGFDYMPGDLWERGLVPSELIREAGGLSKALGLVIEIDEPRPLGELVDEARPFKTKRLKDGLTDEAYLDAFLKPFGATRVEAVRYTDKAGYSIPISADLFKTGDGTLKVRKRGREVFAAQLAEAIMEPDEIWMGVRGIPAGGAIDYIVDRRYIRVDRKTGLIVVFQIGRKGWEATTAYNSNKKGKADLSAVDNRRGGKLLYQRKK